eukprot:7202781-Pyramimonas_sp.AAC.1
MLRPTSSLGVAPRARRRAGHPPLPSPPPPLRTSYVPHRSPFWHEFGHWRDRAGTWLAASPYLKL